MTRPTGVITVRVVPISCGVALEPAPLGDPLLVPDAELELLGDAELLQAAITPTTLKHTSGDSAVARLMPTEPASTPPPIPRWHPGHSHLRAATPSAHQRVFRPARVPAARCLGMSPWSSAAPPAD